MSIRSFDFPEGQLLAERYEIVRRLGEGWESEVYLVKERATSIERAAKVFLPARNPGNRVARKTAKKLHELRHCGALIQYITHEAFEVDEQPVTMLISEYVDGQVLAEFLAAQPSRRLTMFEALHVLYALATALEPVHQHREYHGDLHAGNIIVRRSGLGFEIKLIDIFHHRQRKSLSIQNDVLDLIRLFYDMLGGRRHYARQPAQVKQICLGLKRTLISKRFRHAGHLKRHLETLRWDD